MPKVSFQDESVMLSESAMNDTSLCVEVLGVFTQGVQISLMFATTGDNGKKSYMQIRMEVYRAGSYIILLTAYMLHQRV